MPLVRYKSGDITRFLKGPTKSGLSGQRAEKLKGRLNEWTPTAMGNIAPWLFEPIFNRLNSETSDWQIVVEKDSENKKDVINFYLESENASADAVRQKFFKEFELELSDAWKQYQMGLFKIDFLLKPKGSLRQGRKLVRLIDRRKF